MDLEIIQEKDRLVICFQLWNNKLYKRIIDKITNEELDYVILKDFNLPDFQQETLPKFEV